MSASPELHGTPAATTQAALGAHQVTEVASEMAYDLMQEHFETILELLEAPMPEAQALARLGSPKVLDRLARHGLVHRADGKVSAVGKVYDQMRQEGMLSFLERSLLPALAAGSDVGLSTCEVLHLSWPVESMTGWYEAHLLPALKTLTDIVDRPARGPHHRLSLFFLGTSKVETELLGFNPEDSILRVVRAAALERTSADKARARLTQVDALVDAERYSATLALVQDLTTKLAAWRSPSPDHVSYHLAIASHWRAPTPRVPSAVAGSSS